MAFKDFAGSTLEQAADSARDRNNFNLLRLLAALSVIYGHAYAVTGTPGGDLFITLVGHRFIGGVAVDVFFFTSGFLVTASAMHRGSPLYFLICRGLRIYPALFVCLVLTTCLLGPLVTTAPHYWTAETSQYFFSNLFTYKYTLDLPGVFTNLKYSGVNGPIWTIFLEVRLYLLIALLFWSGIIGNRTLFNVVVSSVIIIYYLVPALPTPIQSDDYFHRQICMIFLVGSFYYVNRKFIILNPAVLMGLLFIVGMAHQTDRFFFAYYLFLPYFVVMFAYMPGLAWFNRVGDYSYGIYLYGWPVQQAILLWKPGMGAIDNAVLASLISLTLAMLSWHLVESSMLRLKNWRGFDRTKAFGLSLVLPSSMKPAVAPAAAPPADVVTDPLLLRSS